MYSNTKKNIRLPDEVEFFKKNNIKKSDPIKREIFSFSELVYIMDNISPFSVDLLEYFNYSGDNSLSTNLLNLLALSYIGNKVYMQEKDDSNLNTNVYISLQDIYYTHSFIYHFFDFDRPILDNKRDDIIWIYPKLRMKRFLADSLFNKKYINYYFEKSTLNKLILIMSGFVKYEYKNSDDTILNQIEQLNYPTLILANISLYEKGILKLTDDKHGIGIMIDMNAEKKNEKVFTDNEYELKKAIISLVNSTENSYYTINDFL